MAWLDEHRKDTAGNSTNDVFGDDDDLGDDMEDKDLDLGAKPKRKKKQWVDDVLGGGDDDEDLKEGRIPCI